MMVNIFYAGNNDEWGEYKVHIKNALDDLNIKYSMTRNQKTLWKLTILFMHQTDH